MTDIELLVYIAITGLSAVFFGMCVIFRKRRLNTLKGFTIRWKAKLQYNDERNVQSTESLYDIIDEQSMLSYSN